jgi:hypothetical protein
MNSIIDSKKSVREYAEAHLLRAWLGSPLLTSQDFILRRDGKGAVRSPENRILGEEISLGVLCPPCFLK